MSGGSPGSTKAPPITNNPELDCKMNTYFNQTSPTKTGLDAEVQYEINYEQYVADVQQEQGAIAGSLLAYCTDPSVQTPDPVSCRSRNSFILVLNNYVTRLFSLRSIVQKGVPVQAIAPDELLQLSLCDQFVGAPTDPGLLACQSIIKGANEALLISLDRLRSRKHELGVDLPFVAPKAQKSSTTIVAAARRPGFHPRVRALAIGSLSLRQGRRATLVVRFSRQAREALRRSRRAGVKRVRVTAVVDVEIQAGRHSVHRIPLTLLLVRPSPHR
ncbi:MAG: hypothetical protein WAU75_03095 [Solirubrobacteraceae bacterium]